MSSCTWQSGVSPSPLRLLRFARPNSGAQRQVPVPYHTTLPIIGVMLRSSSKSASTRTAAAAALTSSEGAPTSLTEAAQQVNTLLDKFHDAASRSDFDGYFHLFSEDARFLGTDISESWTKEEFSVYAKPAFESCNGWKYSLRAGSVRLVEPLSKENLSHLCFEECLDSARFKITARGTGIAVLVNGEWRIRLYQLTFPVPNDCVPGFIALTGDTLE